MLLSAKVATAYCDSRATPVCFSFRTLAASPSCKTALWQPSINASGAEVFSAKVASDQHRATSWQLVLLLVFQRCDTVDLAAGQVQTELLVVCESPTAPGASFGTLFLVDYSRALVVFLAANVSFGSLWNFSALLWRLCMFTLFPHLSATRQVNGNRSAAEMPTAQVTNNCKWVVGHCGGSMCFGSLTDRSGRHLFRFGTVARHGLQLAIPDRFLCLTSFSELLTARDVAVDGFPTKELSADMTAHKPLQRRSWDGISRWCLASQGFGLLQMTLVTAATLLLVHVNYSFYVIQNALATTCRIRAANSCRKAGASRNLECFTLNTAVDCY